LEKIFAKLARRGPVQFKALWKKARQIPENPHRFNIKCHNEKQEKSAHLQILCAGIQIHEKEKIVELWGYEHHDNMHR